MMSLWCPTPQEHTHTKPKQHFISASKVIPTQRQHLQRIQKEHVQGGGYIRYHLRLFMFAQPRILIRYLRRNPQVRHCQTHANHTHTQLAPSHSHSSAQNPHSRHCRLLTLTLGWSYSHLSGHTHTRSVIPGGVRRKMPRHWLLRSVTQVVHGVSLHIRKVLLA